VLKFAAAAPVVFGLSTTLAPGAAASAIAGMTVFLDPGHNGANDASINRQVTNGRGGTKECQTTGTTTDHGFPEHTFNWDVVLAIRAALGQYGVRTAMSRGNDSALGPCVDQRAAMANAIHPDAVVSIHADALPRHEGDAQGATIYTLSDRASDAEAERLAEAENKADAIGGVNLTEEPTDVADILIDLAQRETRTFSNRFARLLMGEMKTTTRMHKHPLKSAGFRVLKAPDVPSVLVELGYVSNKGDLEHLVSDSWRSRTVASMAQAVDAFLAKRVARAGPTN